jgi:hypothetical protein
MSKKAEIIYRNAARELRRRTGDIFRAVMAVVAREGISPTPGHDDWEAAMEEVEWEWRQAVRAWCEHVEAKRSTYEPLFSMPPARREKSTAAKPLTLVEKRATAAKRKVKEWQRKSKLAATKIKQYQKKIKYYTKKGVVS